MAQPAYQAVRLRDLEREDGWSPIRRSLGVQSFGINAWTGHEVGATVIPGHDEQPTGHEEVYLVTAGHARFTVEGETLEAPTGTIVFVRDSAAMRGAVAVAADTTVLSIGGEPGGVYVPRSWETNRDVFALLDAGRYADAKALLLGALDEYDESSFLLYNLACAEAQLGELDAAFEHLRTAVAQRPSLIEHAQHDDELAPLRNDMRFSQLRASE